MFDNTLLGKIMACFIMTGEIMGGEKYGRISSKPPIFPKFQEKLLVFCPRCICEHYDHWWYLSFHSQIE